MTQAEAAELLDLLRRNHAGVPEVDQRKIANFFVTVLGSLGPGPQRATLADTLQRKVLSRNPESRRGRSSLLQLTAYPPLQHGAPGQVHAAHIDSWPRKSVFWQSHAWIRFWSEALCGAGLAIGVVILICATTLLV
jgi:hypothetical protein